MIKSTESKKEKDPIKENLDFINFNSLLRSLIRNKKFSIFIFLVSLISSIFYAFLNKPIWRGEFQIVLDVKQEGLGLGNTALSNITGQLGLTQSNNLRTEVSILKSSSVLKPTFEFVQKKKKEKGIDITNLNYKNWLKGFLKVDLEMGTSVLNISYIDNDKEIIEPVLRMISDTYQTYAVNKRTTNLINGTNFLKNELRNLEQESQASMEYLQEFSIKNKIGNPDGIPVESLSGEAKSINNINLNNTNLNLIPKLNGISQSSKAIDRNSIAFDELSRLETLLIQKSANFKENSQTIQNLKKQIKEYRTALKRPNEILLEYRKVKEKALKDEARLRKLQDLLAETEFEIAKGKDPWELISNPTIQENPISPSKKRIIALGLVASFFVSLLAALIKDRYLEIITNPEELKSLLPCEEILTLYNSEKSKWNNQLILLISNLNKNSSIKKLCLLRVGDIDQNEIDLIHSHFKKQNNFKNIELFSNTIDTLNYENIILISKPECISKTKLKVLNEELSLTESNLIGFLYIDPN